MLSLVIVITGLYFGLKNSQDAVLARMSSIDKRQDSLELLFAKQQDLERMMDERLAKIEGKLDATIMHQDSQDQQK